MSNPESPQAIWPVRVWRFYRDGFRQMTVGRYLWALILVKLFFIFAVMKLFFFPDILSRDYDTDEERSQAVRQSILAPERVSEGKPGYLCQLHVRQYGILMSCRQIP